VLNRERGGKPSRTEKKKNGRSRALEFKKRGPLEKARRCPEMGKEENVFARGGVLLSPRVVCHVERGRKGGKGPAFNLFGEKEGRGGFDTTKLKKGLMSGGTLSMAKGRGKGTSVRERVYRPARGKVLAGGKKVEQKALSSAGERGKRGGSGRVQLGGKRVSPFSAGERARALGRGKEKGRAARP